MSQVIFIFLIFGILLVLFIYLSYKFISYIYLFIFIHLFSYFPPSAVRRPHPLSVSTLYRHPSLTRTPFLQLMTDTGIGLISNLMTFSACDVMRKTYWFWEYFERYAASQELVISYIVKNVTGRLRSETRLPIVWLDNPRKPSKELIVTKYSLSKLQGKFPRIKEEPLRNYSSWASSRKTNGPIRFRISTFGKQIK